MLKTFTLNKLASQGDVRIESGFSNSSNPSAVCALSAQCSPGLQINKSKPMLHVSVAIDLRFLVACRNFLPVRTLSWPFDILVYTTKLSLSSTPTSKLLHCLFINASPTFLTHVLSHVTRHPPICFIIVNDHAQHDNKYLEG